MMQVGSALPLPYMYKISRKQQTIGAIQRKKKKKYGTDILRIKVNSKLTSVLIAIITVYHHAYEVIKLHLMK